MHAILLLAFLQASPAVEPLRSGCSADDSRLGTVSATDSIQVQMALAGEGPGTCYKIAVNHQGVTTTGYVHGESLPAIATFVRMREDASRGAAEAEARAALARAALARVAPKAGEKEQAKPLDPNVPSRIENFSWRDSHGRSASLSGLGGRVILVTFWPANMRSRDQLDAVEPLYNRFHGNGLSAVSVSMDANPSHMSKVLDDTNYHWPMVPDDSGLAARYHVNPKVGETFVLDAAHNVVAAGLMGPDIVKAVHQLLNESTPPPAASRNK